MPLARVTNMRSEAFFTCSYGAYMIFLPNEAENTTFVIGRRDRKWYFRPPRQKSVFQALIVHVSKNTVRYASEKEILASCDLFILAWLGHERAHEDKSLSRTSNKM